MAAPNLANPTAVYGRTVRYRVTTTMAAALSNAAASNKCLKVITVLCCNDDGVNPCDITLMHNDGTSDAPIDSTISIPADATQALITRDVPIYLEEGHSLRAQAGANNDLNLTISYEEIS